MIIMVGGSRGYPDKQGVEFFAMNHLNKNDVVIHGDCANSPDIWFGHMAEKTGHVVGKFPYVSRLGKSGGHVRNRAMVDMADRCIFFWDGSSSGTGKTIDYAKSTKGVDKVTVILPLPIRG